MQHSPRHLEGLARQLLDETGLDAPIDAFTLAEACGLTLQPWGRDHAELDLARGVIRYPSKPRTERMQFRIAHEVGHWVLVRAGESDDLEDDVDYLASALLLPRAAFLRDLEETAWDLFAMKARHPNASHQAIAVRMCALSPASASIWDAGHLHRAYGNVDEDAHRAAADRALELELPVRGEVSAWPVLEGRHRRVIAIRRAA